MNLKLHVLSFALLGALAANTVQAQDLQAANDNAQASQEQAAQAQAEAQSASTAAMAAQQLADVASASAAVATAEVNAANLLSPDAAAAGQPVPSITPAAQSTMPMATTMEAGSKVTVTSKPSNAVVGDYKIDFDALDRNHDGSLSQTEASANTTLMSEFRAVDANGNGRLSKEELRGWM